MDEAKNLCTSTVNSIVEKCQLHILQNYCQLESYCNTVVLNRFLFEGGVGPQQSPVGHILLIFEVSRSHTITHHSR